MAEPLSIGFSTCPNDTYIFEAMIHGRLGNAVPGWQEPLLEDVETLNQWALAGRLDVSKISCHALAYLLDEYCLLSAGAALGRGCGPLLVSREPLSSGRLASRPVAIPGRYTTAALLMRLYQPECQQLVTMRFDQIMPAIRNGQVAAGVIIHESRFTYQQEGLICIQDLGQWWESVSGRPIPLGCIVARRSLGRATIAAVEGQIRDSLTFARTHPDIPMPYVRCYSQEMSPQVMRSHIGLYVSEYSYDLGKEGLAAIADFLTMGRQKGVLPASSRALGVEGV